MGQTQMNLQTLQQDKAGHCCPRMGVCQSQRPEEMETQNSRPAGASHRPVGSGPWVIRATSGFWKAEPGDPKSHHLLDNEGETK